MQREEHWNTCANRLYYAAFYAVSALLAQEDYVASKHTGVKAIFNQHFVKTGVVTKENGRLYNRLFNLRQEGDYVDFVSFEAETIQPLIEETAAFIAKITTILTHTK
jgi:uncharacterized protein (UPF0332 family)